MAIGYLTPYQKQQMQSAQPNVTKYMAGMAQANPGFYLTPPGTVARDPNYTSPQQQAAQQAQLKQALVGTGQGPKQVTQQYYDWALKAAGTPLAQQRVRDTLSPTVPATARPSVGLAVGITDGRTELILPRISSAMPLQTRGYRPLSEIQQSAWQQLSHIAPDQQERILEQAGSFLRTSGIAEAERRYAELEQTLQQMSYGQRMNQSEVVRTIQQEMEQLQKKIKSEYSLAGKYLQTQINAERRMEESQRMRPSDISSGRTIQVANPDLQSMAARGFYQTPYAYQNL